MYELIFFKLDLTILHQLVQEIIEAIGTKQPLKAKQKMESAQKLLDSLMDLSASDDDLVALSKYQSLIMMLNNKLK